MNVYPESKKILLSFGELSGESGRPHTPKTVIGISMAENWSENEGTKLKNLSALLLLKQNPMNIRQSQNLSKSLYSIFCR